MTATTLDQHVSVQGHLKLGREQLSVTDLTIPVSGIPITIVRTYDSLNAGKSMDFGYGWQLSFGDAQLKVDLAPGADTGWGGFPAFLDGTRVYVTMPGGEYCTWSDANRSDVATRPRRGISAPRIASSSPTPALTPSMSVPKPVSRPAILAVLRMGRHRGPATF